MADSESSASVAEKHKKPISSFFSSPRLLFTNFTSKILYETEAMLSPTSILDSKPFSGFKNPFWSETNSPRTTVGEHKRYCDKLDSKGLVDALIDDKPSGEITSKSQSRMVLFGSQLKIQIPPTTTLSPSQSPKAAADFGIKMRNSQLGKSAFGSANSALETSKSPQVFTGSLSATEMELSEDYTRVISHGPNPRTIHIFDNCVVESNCFDVGYSSSAMENVFLCDHISYPSETFMSFCFYCKKSLGQGIDIYIYRGERAFCSHECRYQGMLLDEGMNILEAEDVYGT